MSEFLSPAKKIDQTSGLIYGVGSTTVASLLGGAESSRTARPRQMIYDKWDLMMSDPICGTALRLLVTAALGGHETSGKIVFVEKTEEAEKDKRLGKIVDDINRQLTPIFNRIAFPMAFTGAGFGDAYARIYAEKGSGVIDVSTSELYRPPLVQPFEQGSRTVGYALYVGQRNFERLDISQLARLQLPRTQWVPQYGVIEKAMRIVVSENDINKMQLLPAMVGGSLLHSAESAYDNYAASITGLVGQRWLDSINEQILTVNMELMQEQQKKDYLASVVSMVQTSKELADKAVRTGKPHLTKLRHIIPVFGDKQLTAINSDGMGGSGRTGNISIEDIILHARLVSGAIGVDLSMIGFADQLSGGLGDGGFFRVSAHAAENARFLRAALSDFFNSIIDIHTLNRLNMVFGEHERPWNINFYSTISALESERARTKTDAMNGGLLLAQGIQLMKDMGADEELMRVFLSKVMLLDEEQSKQFARIVSIKPAEQPTDQPGGNSEPIQ